MDQMAINIRTLRTKIFGLGLREFSDLLGISYEHLSSLETGLVKLSPCLRRIFSYLEERPEEGRRILESIDEWDEGLSKSVSRLMQNLGMSAPEFAAMLDVRPKDVQEWLLKKGGKHCHRLLIWILMQYSKVDRHYWPMIFEIPVPAERGMMTPGRIQDLRKKLGMNKLQFSRLIHIQPVTAAYWETGYHVPTWCGNLILRILENSTDRVSQLLEEASWEEEELSSESAMAIRMNLGLSLEDFAQFLGIPAATLEKLEDRGSDVACVTLLYGLLKFYPNEMVEIIQALPDSYFKFQNKP